MTAVATPATVIPATWAGARREGCEGKIVASALVCAGVGAESLDVIGAEVENVSGGTVCVGSGGSDGFVMLSGRVDIVVNVLRFDFASAANIYTNGEKLFLDICIDVE